MALLCDDRKHCWDGLTIQPASSDQFSRMDLIQSAEIEVGEWSEAEIRPYLYGVKESG